MEGSIATGVVGEALHHHQVADEPQHKIILLEGLTADATLQLLRERLVQLPQATLDLVMTQSTAFWVYTLIISVCFYIFHRLTEVRSEENNIWAIASKERKIEAKIAEEEKEEEKQKDKLERHKLRARKQRLLQELHPSIAKMQHEVDAKRRSLELTRDNVGTSKAGGGATTTLNGESDSSGDNDNNGKKKKKVVVVTKEEKRPETRKGSGVVGEGAHVTWNAADSGSGSDAATTSASASQKKRAKKRRRRLARRLAMADSGITELGS